MGRVCTAHRTPGASRPRSRSRAAGGRQEDDRVATLTIVAGANGAGKSSLTRWAAESLLEPGTFLVDPDAIARERGFNAVAAGREATRLIAALLAAHGDLLVETTLSGRNALRLMEAAAGRGYDVRLLYVCTGDVAINVARIAARVAAGGHDVPKVDIIRRYGRSLANLVAAISRAGEVAIFDNGSESGPVVVARGLKGELEYVASEPRWLADAIGGRDIR